MTKLEKAARQALDALEGVDREFGSTYEEERAITALREALSEQGCSFCNNPLFAGTSCPNCGRAVEPDHFAHVRNMVLTTEHAQQIEEALDELRYANNTDIAKTKYYKALATIRAARAQADHIADADKMVREPVATLHDDGCFTWKSDEFRLLYDRQRAGWRMDVYAAPVQQADILSKSLKRIQSLERQLKIAQQQWDNSREYALELTERLFKYEEGSPIRLNSEQAEQEPDGLEKTLRAILQPAAPFEQMFSTQGEVKMSNNNMREIGYAFVNHAGEFQFTYDCLSDGTYPKGCFLVYATEECFKKACDSARELHDAINACKFPAEQAEQEPVGYQIRVRPHGAGGGV